MAPRAEFLLEGGVNLGTAIIDGDVNITAQRFPEDDQIVIEVGSEEASQSMQRAKDEGWGNEAGGIPCLVTILPDEKGSVSLNGESVTEFDGVTVAYWLCAIGVKEA